MSWYFKYSPYVWPMLASAAFLWALSAYTWRHRAAPGAVALSAGMLIMGLWAMFSTLIASASDPSARLFWFRVENVVNQPSSIAGFCFALGYAGLGGWITWRRLAVLLAPCAAILPLMFYDDSRLLWTGYWVGETVHRTLAPVGVAMNVYALGLLLLSTAVIASVFVRSPMHRMGTSLIILGHLAMLVVIPLQILNVFRDLPLDFSVLSADFAFAMYAIALYRFRLLDVVPVARTTVLERMQDGVVVLDVQNRIADLNPAAQILLGSPRSSLVGRSSAQALKPFPALAELARAPVPGQIEVATGTPPEQCYHQVSSSPLNDQRGFRLGSLIVLHDITPLKQAHEQLLQQERALAALRERELLARELHDELSQELALINLQAQLVSGLLETDQKEQAQAQLEILAKAAREAQVDVRGDISRLSHRNAQQEDFLGTIRHFAETFQRTYGTKTELDGPPAPQTVSVAPTVEVQLLRIVQEAFTNIRKHAGATVVRICWTLEHGYLELSIKDNGVGFDLHTLPTSREAFGLGIMSQRAGDVGGRVEVKSAPGKGTTVIIEVPAAGESRGGI